MVCAVIAVLTVTGRQQFARKCLSARRRSDKVKHGYINCTFMCKEVYLYRSFEPQIMRFSLHMKCGGKGRRRSNKRGGGNYKLMVITVGRHEGWLYVNTRIILKLTLKKYCWLPLTGFK